MGDLSNPGQESYGGQDIIELEQASLFPFILL